MTSEAVIPHLVKTISATTPVLLILQITLQTRSIEKFSFCSITKTETVKALESLNPPTKLMGWDMIPPKLLRLGAKELAPSLTNIFNLAINSGETTQAVGKKENGFLFTKRMKEQIEEITVLSIVNKIF